MVPHPLTSLAKRKTKIGRRSFLWVKKFYEPNLPSIKPCVKLVSEEDSMMKLLLTTVAIFGMGYALARAYRLGDYAVETWQDQFDSGNNYFTIQAYCVD